MIFLIIIILATKIWALDCWKMERYMKQEVKKLSCFKL